MILQDNPVGVSSLFFLQEMQKIKKTRITGTIIRRCHFEKRKASG
jgi:hypothetical protein